ncbi:hypothetical protein DPMN_054101 [Dreissena polymorpha]|uniref:Uncharacterized protein n=1 Tax=Dreissena polymorpha TaxID=45954 RepID=A0A9D4HQX5_DREPO|nr:hypothetical protein DPMN_054101 [Dreissena polymorpha]
MQISSAFESHSDNSFYGNDYEGIVAKMRFDDDQQENRVCLKEMNTICWYKLKTNKPLASYLQT